MDKRIVRETRSCRQCRNAVTRRPSEFKRNKMVFCNIQCANAYKNVPGREIRRKGGPDIKRETRPCAVCGKDVTRRPCEFKSDLAFCGYGCSNLYHNRKMAEGSSINKTCANCGRKFTVLKCQEFRKYCSQSCMGDDRREDKIEITCKRSGCGTKKIVFPSLSGQMYCSQRCHLMDCPDKSNTPIELALQSGLSAVGIKYATQIPVLERTIPDIFIEPNICVYADGLPWHSSDRAKARDARINSFLYAFGYTVLRFTGKEIRNDLGSCIKKIVSAVGSAPAD